MVCSRTVDVGFCACARTVGDNRVCSPDRRLRPPCFDADVPPCRFRRYPDTQGTRDAPRK